MGTPSEALQEFQQAGQTGLYRGATPTLSDGDKVSNLVDASGNAKTTQATATDNVNDSITPVPGYATVNLTASGQVLSAPGSVIAVEIVSFTTGATVRLSDALTATTPYISSAVALTLDGTTKTGHKAGDEILKGIQCATGGYITITGTCEIIAKVKLNPSGE